MNSLYCQEDGPVSGKRICIICKKCYAKYTCPKCLIRTCSLPCVNKHKKMEDCDGVRDRTAFVPLHEYNENNMLSDLCLLEEIARSNASYEKQLAPCNKTKLMMILQKEAKKLNIQLRLAPRSFVAHRCNSTVFIRKTKSFQWHTAWHFPKINMSIQRKRVPESNIVLDVLRKTCEGASGISWMIPHLNQDVCIFMQRPDCPSNERKYWRININETVKTALIGKTINEFPSFIVTLQSDAAEYENKLTVEEC